MDLFEFFANLDDLEDELLESLSSSSESEEEQPSQENFSVEVIPNFDDRQFQSHFRIAPNQFQSLCETLGPILDQGSFKTPIEKICQVGLWYLSNMECMR